MSLIRPQLIAAKFHALRQKQSGQLHPSIPDARIIESVWFLQAESMTPNRLEEIAIHLLTSHRDKFISSAMKRIGVPKSGRYSLDQCLELWHESYLQLNKLFRDKRPYAWRGGEEILVGEDNPKNFSQWVACYKTHKPDVLADGVKRFNFDFFHTRCLDAARSMLKDNLTQLCADESFGLHAPWYCPDLLQLLGDYMDACSVERRAAIAETEITRMVFRELEFAWSQNVPVPIVGESRIGKTSPAFTWCHARPGRARLVTVPESNRMRDFIEAHADAFGLEYTPKTSLTELTASVKYVHQHSGLFIAYDESQFLVPVKYNEDTPPSRINFVRCQVIDRNLGCAFFATPQSYRQTLDQYVKTTGYRIEQWLGRMFRTGILPPDLGRNDMLAIAKLNFPGLPEPYLKLIAARAMRSEGYIKNMEFTAKRALFIAGERGHSTPALEDVEEAIADIMPEVSATASQPRRETAAATPPHGRSAGAKDTLPGRSVNLICPNRDGSELAPAD